jgi:hypothetical protein
MWATPITFEFMLASRTPVQQGAGGYLNAEIAFYLSVFY